MTNQEIVNRYDECIKIVQNKIKEKEEQTNKYYIAASFFNFNKYIDYLKKYVAELEKDKLKFIIQPIN